MTAKRLTACLLMLSALAACGTNRPVRQAAPHYAPGRYYAPPGPPSDPWGPYIREAAGRFDLPERWIRRVMRQESGGQEDVISWAGAIGLMQVMPDTYADLRGRYGLGDDPFDPHNNILAGTAYLKEMYDRYGAPGFLAAYNAGPNRLDRYLNNGTPLPQETVNYLAAIAPGLGNERPMTGPLAAYAGRYAQAPVARGVGGCDLDAAYDPSRPCVAAASAAPVAVAYAPPAARVPTPADCDPNAAYDPGRPCVPLPAPAPYAVAEVPAPVAAEPLPAPVPPQRYAQQAPLRYAEPAPPRYPQPAPSRPIQQAAQVGPTAAVATQRGRWGIQVGAFASLSTAQQAAERARAALPELLRTANVELPPTTPFGTQVAFRARLVGLPAPDAISACARLASQGMVCSTVPPS